MRSEGGLNLEGSTFRVGSKTLGKWVRKQGRGHIPSIRCAVQYGPTIKTDPTRVCDHDVLHQPLQPRIELVAKLEPPEPCILLLNATFLIIIIIIEGLSLLQSIPPTTADKQTQAQKRRGSRSRKLPPFYMYINIEPGFGGRTENGVGILIIIPYFGIAIPH